MEELKERKYKLIKYDEQLCLSKTVSIVLIYAPYIKFIVTLFPVNEPQFCAFLGKAVKKRTITNYACLAFAYVACGDCDLITSG